MGVRRLETYLEKYCIGGCYKVSIAQLIQENRSQNGSKDFVIVVDGMATLRFLYAGLDFINGGQLTEFGETVKYFVRQFESAGARLVFYFDGPLMPQKRLTWIRRRETDIHKLAELFDRLESGTRVNSLTVNDVVCLPVGIRSAMIHVLTQDFNCEVRIAIKECDEEIATYAKKMNCSAILSQDTDFVIYNSAPYYLSMKHFNIRDMTTMVYDSYALAQNLNIGINQLPLLASLLGNDVICSDRLQDFHRAVIGMRGNAKFINTNHLIVRISNIVRNVRSENDFQAIAERIFGDRSQSSVLWESISSYDIRTEDTDVQYPEDSVGWQKILTRGKELCVENKIGAVAYQVLLYSILSCSSNMEDFRKPDIPLSRDVLANLRRKLYGILLYEKPLPAGSKCHYVEELVAGHSNSFVGDTRVEPLMPTEGLHPGLLVLWDGVGKNIQETRWKLIGDVMKLDESKLETIRKMNPRLVKPVLALIYIIGVTKNECLFDWEIDAILAMVFVLQHYNPQKLKSLPSDPVDLRAVQIFVVLTRTLAMVSVINKACGKPLVTVKEDYCLVDGKLHRLKYFEAKKGTCQYDLCENSESTFQEFNTVRKFIMDAAAVR